MLSFARLFFAVFALGALTVGCASVEPIPYTPDTSAVKDPQAEIRALILANTTAGCVTEPEFTANILNIKHACTNHGVGNSTVRFDRIKEIKLAKSGEWYRCTVVHTEGIDEWFWTSKSKQDMEQLANAIAALAGAAGSEAPADDEASTAQEI